MKFGQKMINKEKNESLPVRGAWIEIPTETVPVVALDVAPRKGSAD